MYNDKGHLITPLRRRYAALRTWVRRGFQDQTSWDWLDLLSKLLLPVWIASLVLVVEGQRQERLTRMQVDVQESISRAQLEIEDERTRQGILDSYLRDMRELILDRGLSGSQPDDAVVEIAQINTQIAISQLDPRRNASITIFLAQSGLLDLIRLAVIDLSEVDLQNAELSSANLFRANLSGANLGLADLSDANLSFANLSSAFLFRANLFSANLGVANLSDAILENANLGNASLSFAYLSGADLEDANLGNANLSFANLSGVDLSDAELNGAVLRDADLSGAFLEGANLGGVLLEGANLNGATGWTSQQLAQAESLVRATMPDGTKMTEEARVEFKKQYRSE